MKKLIVLLLILLSASQISAQNFCIGTYDTLHSSILNENRRILVYIPSGDTSVRYPVLYLLDGESHFTKTLGIIDHLSRTAGNERCPQMIVVAVFHPNRERDLIPTSVGTDADKFPQFLEQELLPYVDKQYPTEPYRVLVGHSLGGLRVVNTFVYQSHLFQSYIALDPSLGMVPKWIDHANSLFTQRTYADKALYIAMGMTMPKEMDTASIFRDTSGNARHMRCIMSFARNAASHPHNGLDFNWKYYPDESHQSVVFNGTYDGLVSNFSWYENEFLYDIFKPTFSAEASVQIITNYYKRLSKKMGYEQIAPEQGISELIDYLNYKRWHEKALAFAELNRGNYPNSKHAQSQYKATWWNTKKSLAELYPQQSAKEICKLAKAESKRTEPTFNISEDAINTLGYNLLSQRKLNDALLLFKLNIELYPNSYNVYDSYGECLLKLGKQTEGLKAYQQSLELNPKNTNASRILEKYSNNIKDNQSKN